MDRRLRPKLLTLIILLGVALSASAFAQTLSLPSASSSGPAVAMNSPQATVETFVQDMRIGDLSDARAAMDLSKVPFPVRDSMGDTYAYTLVAILARIPKLKPQDLPANATSTSYPISVVATNGKLVAELSMQKTAGGNWVFDSTTVSDLPRLYDQIRSWPQANELGTFPEPPRDPSMQVRAMLPPILLTSVLWLEAWQWLGLGVLILASLIVAFAVRLLVRLMLRLFFRHWEKNLLPSSLKALRRSAGFLAGMAVWFFAYNYLGLQQSTTTYLVLVVVLTAAWIIAFTWGLVALSDVLLDTMGSRTTTVVRRADQILIPIAKKFVRFVLYIGAILAFAASMSVNIAGLVAGLGIGGLVIALAGKDSVENIFGSLTIIFDMPFGLGDYIKISAAEGTVEEINLRSTRVRTPKDTLITVPNSQLITATVENFGSRRYRQFKVVLPLSYINQLQHIQSFCEEIHEWASKQPKIQQDKSYVDLTSVNDTSVGLSLDLYFDTGDYSEERRLREEVVNKLMEAARDAKVILGAMAWNSINAPQDVFQPLQPSQAAPPQKP